MHPHGCPRVSSQHLKDAPELEAVPLLSPAARVYVTGGKKTRFLRKDPKQSDYQWTVESRLPNHGGGGDDDDEDDNTTNNYTQTLTFQTVFTFSPFIK